MDIGRGRVERNLDAIGKNMRQQAVNALIRDLEAHALGPGETFRSGVDPHHPDRLKHRAAAQLVNQVGANIA